MKTAAFTNWFARALLIGSLLAVAVVTAGAAATHPQEILPPALPWHGASEVLVANSDDPWITPAEATGLMDTPDWERTFLSNRPCER